MTPESLASVVDTGLERIKGGIPVTSNFCWFCFTGSHLGRPNWQIEARRRRLVSAGLPGVLVSPE